ncbi:lysosomal amino acid transporter 1 homolog [Lissotriton helveticus]
MDVPLFRGQLGAMSSMGNISDCPNGTQWIWIVLSECTQGSRDIASVILGLFSLLCFMGASFPQYWQSCKTGNMDQALSIWFLLAWLFGDSCNLIGTFLAHQLPLQTYTAVYYVVADIMMLSLFFYYKFRNMRRQSSLITSINVLSGVALIGLGTAFSSIERGDSAAIQTPIDFKRRNLLSAGQSESESFTTNEKIGIAIGALSSLLYLLSRVPQILNNFRRKSTEGVALSLFVMAILGNLTYGLSVLVKNPEEDQAEGSYMLHHLPWLIGSLGVVCLDLFIIFQFFLYRKRDLGTGNLEDRDRLLSSENGPIYA